MRQTRYLGKGQIAVCQRSGEKIHASRLVRDGRLTSLLVSPEWADPAQPQENPYVPDDLEGVARFPISPDTTPATAPVLTLEVQLSGTTPAMLLDWTAAYREAGPRIEEYDLLRDSGEGFILIDTLLVEYDMFGAILGPGLEYTDEDVDVGTTYSYRVIALTSNNRGLTSNTVTGVSVQPVPDFHTALMSSSANGSDFTAPAAWGWGSSDFTCEFWFMFIPGPDNTQYRVLRARPLGGAQSGWEAQVRATGNPATKTMRLLLRPASTSFTFDSIAVAAADNVWCHFAFVVDQTANLVEFFLNGVSQGTTSTATGAGASGTVGGKSIMHAIGGAVDELRVWTGKRTPAELLANYNLPFDFPLVVPQPTLVADFQFNEGAGTTTVDSVQGTIATLVSGATFVPGPAP